MKDSYVIGVDFGTDSVRALIINALTGETAASHTSYYKRWKDGLYCDPHISSYRQHPLDYLESMVDAIKTALSKCSLGINEKIASISVDTTGSTICAVNKDGTPLALLPDFKNDPDAMFILWKDHTANAEADEITQAAKNWGGVDYTQYVGGSYSSEWFWAKILHTLRKSQQIKNAAYSWIEHCDWVSGELAGIQQPVPGMLKRSRCAAGHKAMWHETYGGLPENDFFASIDPLLSGINSRLYTTTYTSDQPIGTIAPVWAATLDINPRAIIGVGSFDAHMGAVGAQIEPYYLCKVIGTSTCDMLIAPNETYGSKQITGICGQVDGSIIPGMLGMEAGQSAYGDLYAWFRDFLLWPVKTFGGSSDITHFQDQIISSLSAEAEKTDISASIVATDWINGRRTPYTNHRLTSAIAGLHLGTTPPQVFRALVEATAFGSKSIVDCFTSQGIDIKGIIALGGVAKKSPFAMQVLADVLQMNIRVAASEQACALGAAMYASVCAGIHPDIYSAQKTMGAGFEKEYRPNTHNKEIYEVLYNKYLALGHHIEAQI